MKISLCSDLHLEFSDVTIENENKCDVLILSGDIMVAVDLYDNPEDKQVGGSRRELAYRYREFLSSCSTQFKHVVYIAGNHEFYRGKFHESISWLKQECDKFKNIHFLEQSSVEIDDVLFLGATLWTNCNKGDPHTQYYVSQNLNDYKVIRNDLNGYTKLRPADTILRHRESLAYFKKELSQCDKSKKVVVVGHHSPSHMSIHHNYKDEHLMNGGYHSDLSEFILDHDNIVLWTHGHVHNAFDYTIGNTRVVCNPRGYQTDRYKEDTGWDPDLVIEI